MHCRVERVLKRIYQEFFGVIRIITSIAILLIVELLNFVLKHILQPLIIGVFGTLGEFFCKPLLSICFNGFVQPLGIFFWNAAVSFRHMFGPIGDILRRILKEFAMCCTSFKPIQIHYKTGSQPELQNVWPFLKMDNFTIFDYKPMWLLTNGCWLYFYESFPTI